MSLKEMFLKRIYEELEEFKTGIMEQGKESIYASAYAIDSYTTLYEALVASIDDISVTVLLLLVNSTGKILESIFNDYTKLHGDQYSSMEKFIKEEAG